MSGFAPEDIRQVALLLGALEEKEYAAISARLPAKLRVALQDASVDLRDVDADERDRVIQQFLHGYQRRMGQRAMVDTTKAASQATLQRQSFASLVASNAPRRTAHPRGVGTRPDVGGRRRPIAFLSARRRC